MKGRTRTQRETLQVRLYREWQEVLAMDSGSTSGNIYIPNTECQVRGAGGLKGVQGSPQVPVSERDGLDST